MGRFTEFYLIVVLAIIPVTLGAETPAQQRLRAASELQRTFDGSLLKGWQLKFVPRGEKCDVLHVEGYTNLEPTMMEALAYGTLIYGKVLPGGVNNYAFSRGFRNVVYTNFQGATYRSFGAEKVTRKQVKRMQQCNDKIAARVSDAGLQPPQAPKQPPYVNLSWYSAVVGVKIYDGTFRHAATIVHVDRTGGLIYVKYADTGSVEAKKLDAVAPYWYVHK